MSVHCEYCKCLILPGDRQCMTCGAPPPKTKAGRWDGGYPNHYSTSPVAINWETTAVDYNVVMATTEGFYSTGTLESS